MPKRRVISRNVAPAVVEAFERFDAVDRLWMVYDVGGPCHWKLPGIWQVYCRVQRRRGDPEYRCYRVPARRRDRAREKVLAQIAGPYAVTVTLYRISEPMSRATIDAIQRYNARIRRWRESRRTAG